MTCKHVSKRPDFQNSLYQWKPSAFGKCLVSKEPSVGMSGGWIIYICELLSYFESLPLKVKQIRTGKGKDILSISDASFRGKNLEDDM